MSLAVALALSVSVSASASAAREVPFADTPIAPVTLRQVLQSRSGLADGLIPAFQSDPEAVFATPDDTATLDAAREAWLAGGTGS